MWYAFAFDPISDSAERTYYFQLDAPAADLGRAITAYLNPTDAHPDGTAYRAGQPIPGDLIFRAYFKTDAWTSATFWLTELKAYKPSIWGMRACTWV